MMCSMVTLRTMLLATRSQEDQATRSTVARPTITPNSDFGWMAARGTYSATTMHTTAAPKQRSTLAAHPVERLTPKSYALRTPRLLETASSIIISTRIPDTGSRPSGELLTTTTTETTSIALRAAQISSTATE